MNYYTVHICPGVLKTTPERILKAVSEVTGIKEEVIIQRSNKREIVDARAVVAILTKEMTGLTLEKTGEFIKKHHTVVLHYIKKLQHVKEVHDLITKVKKEL